MKTFFKFLLYLLVEAFPFLAALASVFALLFLTAWVTTTFVYGGAIMFFGLVGIVALCAIGIWVEGEWTKFKAKNGP